MRLDIPITASLRAACLLDAGSGMGAGQSLDNARAVDRRDFAETQLHCLRLVQTELVPRNAVCSDASLIVL